MASAVVFLFSKILKEFFRRRPLRILARSLKAAAIEALVLLRAKGSDLKSLVGYKIKEKERSTLNREPCC